MKYSKEVSKVMAWFKNAVTYDGQPYEIDYEQAMAVVDNHFNTIVVARAGSGKTRTLVAKVVYLVARWGILPEEIMAFVFNANAAREINERLSMMRVNGEAIMSDAKIAVTFHAFARKLVYENSDSTRKNGKILAGEKEAFVRDIVVAMAMEKKWKRVMGAFVGETDMDGKVMLSAEGIDELAKLLTTFINRAQQRFLGGDLTLGEAAKEYLAGKTGSLDGVDLASIDAELEKMKYDAGAWLILREVLFVRIGVECYRRYHQVLLGAGEHDKAPKEYSTDFNLIVSWASKIIMGKGRRKTNDLRRIKYLLIDEYQDFSQLFLGVIFALRSVATGAKLFVVGDDWQAINRFAGSEVEYFRHFEEYFGGKGDKGCMKYEITTNYRCDRAVVETARKFMRKSMKEKGNFRAFSRKEGKVVVINPNETEVGYALVPYDLRVSIEDRILREAAGRMGCVAVNKSMVKYLKTIMMVINQNLGAREILILHRNNETNIGGASLVGLGEGLRWGLDRLGVMSASDFDDKVKLMTMHKSKGLEADVVIILEVDEGVIPKLHPDTMLFGVFGETEEIALADQKRLFYVAMTRAKHRLYIISRGDGFMKYVCHNGRGLGRILEGGGDGARYGGR